ncbi:hypothetical protein SKAU_G00294360 [Synaphobranchus kaupii]|uniref:BMERB domain-containing protein n=1 Tax=Synaphobranchus kaupii TaxID=118154 RepID=A0A9Q1EUG8_SYNKA|nr:hypothetical protein SKAU_G00294360 [Synaphobranchus kaupii]
MEDGEREIDVSRKEKEDEVKEGDERRETEDGEKKKVGRGIDENEEQEVKLKPLVPPSPSEHSKGRGPQEEVEEKKRGGNTSNRGLLPVPVGHLGSGGRPVPSPRQSIDSLPGQSPALRSRPSKVTDSPTANGVPGNPGDVRKTSPSPRERLLPPARQDEHTCVSVWPSGTCKRRDPPWMELVEPGPWRRLPPARATSLPHYGSVPCLWGRGSRLAVSTNPFEAENTGQESVREAGPVRCSVPPSVMTSHPWYGLSRAATIGGQVAKTVRQSHAASAGSPANGVSRRDSPSAGNPAASNFSPSHIASPSSWKAKGRLAGGVPQPSPTDCSSAERLPVNPSCPLPRSVSLPALSGSTYSSPSYKPELPTGTPLPPSLTSISSAPEDSQGAGVPSALTKLHVLTLAVPQSQNKNPINQKSPPSYTPKPKAPEDPRPPAPGHVFPVMKRKVQSAQLVPVEDIQVEMRELEHHLNLLELRGVELERNLRGCQSDEQEETVLVDWFTLIHQKHMMVRREAELVYTEKQQNLEERQAGVEYELRCLLNKPEREWSKDDRMREQQLMAKLVAIIEERNHIINRIDQDKQRQQVEDRLLTAMIKRKDFHKESGSTQRKRAVIFKPIKVLKMLTQKAKGGKSKSPHTSER